MMSLKFSDTPQEMAIIGDVVFTVRPMSGFDMAVAQAEARQLMAGLEKSVETVETAGLLPARQLDLRDGAVRDGLYQDFLVCALAVRHIISWTGVGDENGNPLPCDADIRRQVVRFFPIGTIFYQKLTAQFTEMFAAKKESPVAPHGISSAAAEENIATDA